MSSQSTLDVRTTPCTAIPEVYQHPLVEEGRAATTAAERREQAQLTARAERACLECPLLTECLYAAVVDHDVAGIAGGTTARQRKAMRAKLGIRVEQEDFEGLLGLGAGHIDSHEVLRQRMTHPQESLEQLAKRIGCSLSTVKRHLRKARAEQPAPRLSTIRPSREQVMHAYREVTRRQTIGQVAVTRAA